MGRPSAVPCTRPVKRASLGLFASPSGRALRPYMRRGLTGPRARPFSPSDFPGRPPPPAERSGPLRMCDNQQRKGQIGHFSLTQRQAGAGCGRQPVIENAPYRCKGNMDVPRILPVPQKIHRLYGTGNAFCVRHRTAPFPPQRAGLADSCFSGGWSCQRRREAAFISSLSGPADLAARN